MSLILASQSRSRRTLLDIAKIPYILYAHAIDERACSWSLPLEHLVVLLARAKMEAVTLPAPSPDSEFGGSTTHVILTADTLTQDSQGTIHGKPSSHDEALTMFAAFRNHEARIATGFRLERRIWHAGSWLTDLIHEEAVFGTCLFSIPESRIQEYLTHVAVLSCAGGMEIEGYGMQFVRYVTGSYSAIMGLPLFEVQSVLDSIGFFNE